MGLKGMWMDEQTVSDLRRLARLVGGYLGTFIVGGLIALVYSHTVLHDAKNWRIDYLEEQLEVRQEQLATFQTERRRLKADTAGRPDTDTFVSMQRDLEARDSTIADLEKKLTRSAREIKQLERSRDSWKSRHVEAESRREALASEIEVIQERAAAAPVPAAPAPAPDDRARIASNVEVALGEGWSSDDGRARFNLVAVEADQAEVVPDATTLAPGSVPTAISVRVGDYFRIGLSSGRALRVFVQRINGESSITVDVTE
jgi:hypothetical protein